MIHRTFLGVCFLRVTNIFHKTIIDNRFFYLHYLYVHYCPYHILIVVTFNLHQMVQQVKHCDSNKDKDNSTHIGNVNNAISPDPRNSNKNY